MFKINKLATLLFSAILALGVNFVVAMEKEPMDIENLTSGISGMDIEKNAPVFFDKISNKLQVFLRNIRNETGRKLIVEKVYEEFANDDVTSLISASQSSLNHLVEFTQNDQLIYSALYVLKGSEDDTNPFYLNIFYTPDSILTVTLNRYGMLGNKQSKSSLDRIMQANSTYDVKAFIDLVIRSNVADCQIDIFVDYKTKVTV